ncbi:MAG: hypothetical protein M1825_002810 [Sarcosagium campestre]|nr:MAG: hypothetical protein M1825_002810 [Sarcosagium campestre]
MLSFGSSKSDKTHKAKTFSQGKVDLRETKEEKQRRKMKSKADPTVALDEREPAAVAADKVSSMESIRNIQHKDHQGNPIVEPDRSNPTRSRWERPLDTIRSFEAAIDGGSHSRERSSMVRSESTDALSSVNNSRRTSYYQGPQSHYAGRGQHEYGSFGGRAGPSRPDSYAESQYGQRAYIQPPMLHGQYNRPRLSRLNPAAAQEGPSHAPHVYPSPGYQNSYDNVTSTSGSGTDPWTNTTDPSSENSSVDRLQAQKPDVGESYGFSGFGGAPQLQPPSPLDQMETSGQYDQQAPAGYSGYGHGDGDPGPSNRGYVASSQVPSRGLPPVPAKDTSQPPRVPIKLGGSADATTGGESSSRPGMGEKRKSWLKRFSRSN